MIKAFWGFTGQACNRVRDLGMVGPWSWQATVATGVVLQLWRLTPGSRLSHLLLWTGEGRLWLSFCLLEPWAQRKYTTVLTRFSCNSSREPCSVSGSPDLTRDIKIKGQRDEKRESMVWQEKYWLGPGPCSVTSSVCDFGASHLSSWPQSLNEKERALD